MEKNTREEVSKIEEIMNKCLYKKSLRGNTDNY